MIPPPRNKAERIALYGQPIKEWGDPRLVSMDIWEWFPAGLPLSWAMESRATTIRVHQLVVSPLRAVFDRLAERDALALIQSYGGAWNYRNVRGGSNLSMHSWGVAVDINTATNRLGEYGDMPWVIVEAFEHFGWTWGGEWTRPDYQHFQYAG